MGNFSTSPPLSNLESQTLKIANKISPNILLIILIIAIIFFISGLLHLLIRLLLRPTTQNNPNSNNNPNDHHVSVLEGQLQQLFHLHDSGVDQSYIDTLPLFYYKDIIIGLKRIATDLLDPGFDCVVCLCEFESHDKLRLLPKCSHAFHMECIDTWLLSHSTCPLCRSSLLLDYVNNDNINPIVCVLESNSVEHSREIVGSFRDSGQFRSGQVEFPRKSCEKHEEKILNVKLGKFRNNVDNIGEGTSENNKSININISEGNINLGSRRCYSMGSFAYVLDETTLLQVPVKNTPVKKKCNKKTINRAIMSEYGCDSQREFISIDKLCSNGNGNGNGSERSKRRLSFSISKIWEKNKEESSSKNNSEIDIDVSEIGVDEETQSCYSIDSIAYPTTSNSSSNRRTLLWLMGRQNKVFHNHSTSLSSNV